MNVAKDKRSDPNPEVLERPRRRKFSAQYKMRIVHEADACDRGQVGALLRREGLHSSHLSEWRKQRDHGGLEALEPKKRGRKETRRRDPVALENERLVKENARLQRKLKQAEAVITVQKKVSEILGIELEDDENDGRKS